MVTSLRCPVHHVEKHPDHLADIDAASKIHAEHHRLEEHDPFDEHGSEQVPVEADVLARVIREQQIKCVLALSRTECAHMDQEKQSGRDPKSLHRFLERLSLGPQLSIAAGLLVARLEHSDRDQNEDDSKETRKRL